jgi:uncharacterized protein
MTAPVPAPTSAPNLPTSLQPRHTLLRSAILHLLPGLVMLGFYLIAAPRVVAHGFPPLFASLLAIPLILVPWMIGALALESRRRSGSWEPMRSVSYRVPIGGPRGWMLAMAAIVWGAVVFALADRILPAEAILRYLHWTPAWFRAPAELDAIASMPNVQLALFLASLLIFAGLVAPVVEEIYFRGWLLPAIDRFGWVAPVLGTALFTLYHFESPWENPARFVAVLPMVVLVWWRRSVALGIVVHVALNLLSAVATIAVVVAVR